MSLFAIADIHLSFYNNKKMDIFGDTWVNHDFKIKENWLQVVKNEDTVILPGDISWGINIEEAKPDLDFISKLPGKKIIHEGNHDYWWTSTSKLKNLYDNIIFMKNSFVPYRNYAICGGRGWTCPNETSFTSQDNKIYLRELKRITMSFEAAIKEGYSNFIMSMHYPPTNDKKEVSGFIDIINFYKVEKVLYGHMHNAEPFNYSFEDYNINATFLFVSADYLNFKPLKIM